MYTYFTIGIFINHAMLKLLACN